MGDKLIDQQLGRQNSDKRGVIQEADLSSCFGLLHKLLHRRRIEDSKLTDQLGRQHLFHIIVAGLVRGRVKQAGRVGRPVRLLRPLRHRFWNHPAEGSFEKEFFPKHFHLQPR